MNEPTTPPGGTSALRVLPGVEGGHDGLPGAPRRAPARRAAGPPPADPADLARGVMEGDRTRLARAITLIESNAPRHFEPAQELLRLILPRAGRSIRVGITGVPGVGKSTFIEALGCALCARGKKVAVLAVDPSSTLTRGSVLGDKTRMEKLSREPNAFIRPSPSSGALGGVARKSRETLLLCEAAGYDTVLVETVGVGQSETAVRSMVDFFLLLMLAGAGDELQGIKKGIIEMADAIAITKADGDNRARAEAARIQTERALHYLAHAPAGWKPRAASCSSVTGEGIETVWEIVEDFARQAAASGALEQRRHAQSREWFHQLLEEEIRQRWYDRPEVRQAIAEMEGAVLSGEMPATAAVRELLSRPCFAPPTA